MTIFRARDWPRYFHANANSASTVRLNAAEQIVENFRMEFNAFAATVPATARIVMFSEDATLPANGFGVELMHPKAMPHPAHWITTPYERVLIAREGFKFDIDQKKIVAALRELPPLSPHWTLGDGGDADNDPALGGVIVEKGGELKLCTMNAWRLRDGWLMRVPVNPQNGAYYRPPQSVEINAAEARMMSGGDIDKLTTFLSKPSLPEMPVYHNVIRHEH